MYIFRLWKQATVLTLIFLGSLATPSVLLANSFDRFDFESPHDRFTIINKKNKYFIGKTPITLGFFEPFLGLFIEDIDIECPALTNKPDLTVTAYQRKRKIIRKFYVAQKLVGEENGCLEINGEGIYFIPQHRNWFQKKNAIKLALGNEFSILQGGKAILSFQKREGHWINTDPMFFTNWNFFENFREAVTQFNIDARMHPSIVDRQALDNFSEVHFELKTAKKMIKFYKVGEAMWAAQLPTAKWLVTSNDWTFFENMNLSQWRDPNFARLRTLADKSLEMKVRLKSLRQLRNFWSESIKKVLHNIMLDRTENNTLKNEVTWDLKRHPSNDNFKVLALALSQTDNPDLQLKISKVLKIRNRPGPTINIEDSDEQRAASIKQWQQWAKNLKD